MTVNFAVGGTATAGTDYVAGGAAGFGASSGTVSFGSGSSTAVVTLNPTADTTVESDETASLTLTAGSGYTVGLPAVATGTITNDDTPTGSTPTLSIADVTVGEGDGTATFVVTLSGTSTLNVTANYATSNGTATAGSDYTATSGTLTILAGSKTATFSVVVTDDVLDEIDETFTVGLSAPANATLADGSAKATIIDNDKAAGPPRIFLPIVLVD